MFYKISKLLRKTAKFGTKITLTKQKFSESNLWVGYRSFTWKGFCCSFTSSSCLHEGENPFCTWHFPSKNYGNSCVYHQCYFGQCLIYFFYIDHHPLCSVFDAVSSKFESMRSTTLSLMHLCLVYLTLVGLKHLIKSATIFYCFPTYSS